MRTHRVEARAPLSRYFFTAPVHACFPDLANLRIELFDAAHAPTSAALPRSPAKFLVL